MMGIALDIASTESFENFVEEQTPPTSWWLTFPRALEQRFERETGAQRCRQLQKTGIAALVLTDLYVLIDHCLVPDIMSQMLIFRFGILTPVSLFILWFLGRNPPRLWREFLVTLAPFLVALGILYLFVASASPFKTTLLFGVMLAVIGSNILMQPRFPFAFASSAMVFLLTSTAALTADIAVQVKLTSIFFVGTAGLMTLIANYRLERESRDGYLLRLRERLRGEALQQTNAWLQDLSNRDSLTGLANRRLLEDHLAGLAPAEPSDERPIAVLMIDIDDFKAYNDLYGHVAGDEVLKQVATLLQKYMRAEIDLAARYGGEEFTAVIFSNDAVSCLIVAERFRQALERAALPHQGSRFGIVTASIGVAWGYPSHLGSPRDMIAKADAELYAAKRNGRNRIWPPLAGIDGRMIILPPTRTQMTG
jgi:diguanylate cyclase (GGDEF)-like protein